MSSDTVTYHTLGNGLRVVHRLVPGDVECCGVAVNAGSRDESPLHYGLAHFVEHTIFKGTGRRRSHHIINRMETVGGEINAYTTKEETFVYAIFPKGNLTRAAELIADLVTGSTFPADELEREREVVADEINSYLDSPSEAVYDDFEDMVFAGSQLGHNILGSTDTLRHFDSATCRDYLHRYYTAPEMVFFYAGSTPADRLFRTAERYYSHIDSRPAPKCRQIPATVTPFCTTTHVDTHQSHIIIGAPVGSLYDADRYPVALLTNILGGPGMNSRLNVSLRERRGLVYSVDASTSLFTDCGLMTVYFGCDPSDAARCRRLVMTELSRMATDTIPERTLNRAKTQYLGQLVIASANIEQLALSTARATLFHGRAALPDEITDRIMSVTPGDIRSAAAATAPSRCSTLIFT